MGIATQTSSWTAVQKIYSLEITNEKKLAREMFTANTRNSFCKTRKKLKCIGVNKKLSRPTQNASIPGVRFAKYLSMFHLNMLKYHSENVLVFEFD